MGMPIVEPKAWVCTECGNDTTRSGGGQICIPCAVRSMTKAELVDVIVGAYFPETYPYNCGAKIGMREQQMKYKKTNLADTYEKAVKVLHQRNERKVGMTLQYLDDELWEVVWGDDTAELYRKDALRKAGFTDANITVSKEHPEQIFEI